MELDASVGTPVCNTHIVSTQQGVGLLGLAGSGAIHWPKNKKKTATESNDTIRTARFGCFARTLAASSCTDMEIAIRRAMSMSSAANEARPDPSGVGGVGFPSHPFCLSSLDATLNVRGSADSTIESTNTAATSSSSEICASSAASSISRPMPNETLNARSDPREPRAAAVSVMLPKDVLGVTRMLYHDNVESALRESHHLPARLAWQSVSEGGAPLVLRRLLVAPRGIKRSSKNGRSGCGGPVRSVRGRSAYNTQIQSAGTVFGCTLGNVMHHCRARKHKLMHAMRALRRALEPAGRALETANGDDRRFLVRGLACHRLLQAQGRKMQEVKRAPPIDSKMGHVGVVLGATAAILVAFECMALNDEDTEGLGAQLNACLRDAHSAMASWRLLDNMDCDMRDARDAELRALERARAGVARAQAMCAELSCKHGMRLQLDCYRRAAWPADEPLDDEEHPSVLARIHSGELVDQERDHKAAGANAPNVVSLANLANLAALPDLPDLPDLTDTRETREARETRETREAGEESAYGSSGSGSSGWSFASSADSVTAVPLFALDLTQLSELSHLQTMFSAPLLSSAAQRAVAPPSVISGPSLHV